MSTSRAKRNQNNRNRKGYRRTPTNIPKSMAVAGGSVPSERYATLVWNRRGTINNIGSANANETFLISDPLNVDFAHIGTSTNISFWNSYQQQYRQFRVLGATIRAECSNVEPGNALVTLTPVNQAVSQNSAAYDVILDQPQTLKRYPGPLTGNNQSRLQGTYTTAAFGGAPEDKAVDFYVGNTDVSSPVRPTNNWYIVLGASINNATLTVGVDFDITIWFRIRFFEVGLPSN